MKLQYGWLLPLVLVLLSTTNVLAQQDATEDIRSKLEEIAVIDQKVMMPMRDGVRLCTDIYRPKTDEPVPIIFSRTPYNFNSWRDGEESTRTYRRAMQYRTAKNWRSSSAPRAWS